MEVWRPHCWRRENLDGLRIGVLSVDLRDRDAILLKDRLLMTDPVAAYLWHLPGI